MKTVSHEDVLNRFFVKQRTSQRTEFENELKAEILAQQFKELRKIKHLTQTELADSQGYGVGRKRNF